MPQWTTTSSREKGKKSKEKSSVTTGSVGRSPLCVPHMQMVRHIFKPAGQKKCVFFSSYCWKSLFHTWWPNHTERHFSDNLFLIPSLTPWPPPGTCTPAQRKDQKHMALRPPSAMLSPGTGEQFSCTVQFSPHQLMLLGEPEHRAKPPRPAAKEDNRLRWGWSSVSWAQLRHLSSPTVTLGKSFNLSFWLLYL